MGESCIFHKWLSFASFRDSRASSALSRINCRGWEMARTPGWDCGFLVAVLPQVRRPQGMQAGLGLSGRWKRRQAKGERVKKFGHEQRKALRQCRSRRAWRRSSGGAGRGRSDSPGPLGGQEGRISTSYDFQEVADWWAPMRERGAVLLGSDAKSRGLTLGNNPRLQIRAS